MRRGQTVVVYAIVALIIGAVAGYFIAEPVTYNQQISNLEARVHELETGSAAELVAAQNALAQAQAELEDARADKIK